MDVEEMTTVRVTRHFEVAPERVFGAWLDVQLVRQWFAPALGPVVCVDIDPRPGGEFLIVQQRGGEEIEHAGEYTEIARPRRLAFGWRVPPHGAASRVVIDIVPSTTGCELMLTHELTRDSPQHRTEVERAWHEMLDVMSRVL